MKKSYKGWGAIVLILLLLIFDQVFKFWIKTHLPLHESIKITDWFYLYFTENPGMAFGIEIFGKLFLTIFRIAAVGIIGYYLYSIVKKKFSFGYITSVSFVFAGAVGNIIDSIFYGVIFSHSFGQIATFLPKGGGYGTWLHGKVVDMLYFPLIQTTWPNWIPIIGGDEFVFFRPIFNFADSCICVGVFLIVIFYRQYLTSSLKDKK
ncbi:MAG: lipoprotein signal peptidase [Massilibacteroides sp.]|nr:lipoprotein signal peptidase [Massilibacteroides sp.]